MADSITSKASPQTNSEPLSGGPGSQQSLQRAATDKHFSRNKQRLTLLWKLSLRFLISAIICAITAGVLVGYENKTIIPNSGKYLFNALITGLSIGLGINVAVSLLTPLCALPHPVALY